MRISLGPDPSSLSPDAPVLTGPQSDSSIAKIFPARPLLAPLDDLLDDWIERVVAYDNLETYLLEQVEPKACRVR
jgi:hypothetical protein